MNMPPKWLSVGYIALFALLPWSVELGFGSWNLDLPTEPIIGVMAAGLAYSFWQTPGAFFRLFCNNIFLRTSLAYILWMAVSACFSTLPVVSWKYWIIAATHWWVFAAGISRWPGIWRNAFPWFVISIAGVAVFTLVHHAFYDFRTDQAMLAPMPFFPDHTMWAAALAMVLFLNGISFSPVLLLLCTALLFSTCRAAWVSVLLTCTLWGLLLLKKNMRWAMLFVLIASGMFMWNKAARSLEQDVSSQERINRWHCALRMMQEKPLLGFGPGTFQFEYLDFQKPEEMTRISLYKPSAARGIDTYGRGGGAHSEYLRALAETGWPGLLLWLGLISLAVARVTDKNILPESSAFPGVQSGERAFLILLALLTFFAHSVVNDFLHDGCIAALVWGCMAVLFAEEGEV